MVDADQLAVHLQKCYGITGATVSERFDVGVFRIDHSGDRAWVARVFAPERPLESVSGDAAILLALERRGFPAERCADPEPVSVLDGCPVLVTEFVQAGPPLSPGRPAALLGALLGRLHANPADGVRAGGAWHHLSFTGGPREEVAVAAQLLENTLPSVSVRDLAQFDRLRAAVEDTDDCADLPHAFVHPDFVPANAIPTPDERLVIVDWSGAGRGPRLWSIGFLLWAAGVRSLRLVDVVVPRYARHITLEPDELARLAAAIRGRPTMLECWSFCHRRRPLADAVAGVSETAALAERIADRARQAFAEHGSG